ncbi:hypothetical protein LINPERHAP2_LOCUS19915, partial [Linum perenne]
LAHRCYSPIPTAIGVHHVPSSSDPLSAKSVIVALEATRPHHADGAILLLPRRGRCKRKTRVPVFVLMWCS